MDGNGNEPRGDKNAAPSAPAADATQLPALGLETPALSDNDAVAAQQQQAASSDESRGGAGGAEDDDPEEDNQHDDEQVERFYALLANIRAMRRGLPSPHNNMAVASSSSCAAAGDSCTDTAGDSTSTRMKRLRRSAEPPWMPAFRMEDFEEPPPPPAPQSSSCNKLRKRTRGADDDDHGHAEGSGSARPAVAVVASSSMPHAAVRFQ